ncbi:hypothetical protein [Bulleidia sp. zg-1006]|uniref:hypothetical protein n=1 Tax=Bulleidia sp. zg-1006 TaxID=2806552 RepID=UPI00193ADBAD|nr:hypothetical protein [Bulleidia sp. zg-1006]QRG86569.1 hypothetical protein JOS54_06945 [Bulleidia sp. zg-1006]
MKKITVLLLTAVMLIGFAPTKVLACDDCSTGTIDTSKIIGVEVIDNELYIDVLESEKSNSGGYSLYYNLGRCKGKTKTVYGTISKSDLIKYRKKIERDNIIGGAILGALLGAGTGILGNIGIGIAVGIVLSDNKIITAIDDALAHRNYPSKRTFTTRTKFQCEESNMGSRGWVHRYKMIDYYVY